MPFLENYDVLLASADVTELHEFFESLTPTMLFFLSNPASRHVITIFGCDFMLLCFVISESSLLFSDLQLNRMERK